MNSKRAIHRAVSPVAALSPGEEKRVPRSSTSHRAVSAVATLSEDLRVLGLQEGDGFFVQASMRSLGPLEDGAQTVVDALVSVTGSTGLILMPSFHLIERSQRAEQWDVATSEATTGWLTEYFRRMPGTVRSDHYSHSVAARGDAAREWVGAAGPDTGLKSPWDQSPWKRTFGDSSPLFRCYQRGARMLMLGTGYDSLTFLHLVEVMHWNRRLATDPAAEYLWLDRPAAGAVWETIGRFHAGQVGRAFCRLFDVSDLTDTLLARIATDPSLFKSPAKAVTAPSHHAAISIHPARTPESFSTSGHRTQDFVGLARTG